nr:hypothetical protein [Elstera litoralis]
MMMKIVRTSFAHVDPGEARGLGIATEGKHIAAEAGGAGNRFHNQHGADQQQNRDGNPLRNLRSGPVIGVHRHHEGENRANPEAAGE